LATLYVFQWLGYQEVTLPMKREAPVFYMQFADPRAYVGLALILVLDLDVVMGPTWCGPEPEAGMVPGLRRGGPSLSRPPAALAECAFPPYARRRRAALRP
jgi:hypothetical protein